MIFWAIHKDGEGTYIEAIRSMASVLYGSVLQNSNKTCFLDKTPRYYFIIAELRQVYPKARFIFLLRNPLAALSSMLENWFNNQPEKFLKSYNRLDMVKGPELLLKGIRLLADDAIILSYEDLVNSPDVQVRKLCGRLGLEYYPEMLEYDSASMVKGRFGDRVGTPRHSAPVQESLEKWRANLTSSDQLARFGREYLGMLGDELIGGLGYDYIELADALAD